MTVLEIVEEYLKENFYDGLAGDECGCEVDNLFPCGCYFGDCKPGYKKMTPDHPEGHDFIITTEKEDGMDVGDKQ